MPNPLPFNIDRLHTTPLGRNRICHNLRLGADVDPLVKCRELISCHDARFYRMGKNWYVESRGCLLTINASSLTIITARRL